MVPSPREQLGGGWSPRQYLKVHVRLQLKGKRAVIICEERRGFQQLPPLRCLIKMQSGYLESWGLAFPLRDEESHAAPSRACGGAHALALWWSLKLKGPVCCFSSLCHLLKSPETHRHRSLSKCYNWTKAVSCISATLISQKGLWNRSFFNYQNIKTFDLLSVFT